MKLLLWTYIVITLEVILFVPICLLAAVIRDFLWGRL